MPAGEMGRGSRCGCVERTCRTSILRRLIPGLRFAAYFRWLTVVDTATPGDTRLTAAIIGNRTTILRSYQKSARAKERVGSRQLSATRLDWEDEYCPTPWVRSAVPGNKDEKDGLQADLSAQFVFGEPFDSTSFGKQSPDWTNSSRTSDSAPA